MSCRFLDSTDLFRFFSFFSVEFIYLFICMDFGMILWEYKVENIQIPQYSSESLSLFTHAIGKLISIDLIVPLLIELRPSPDASDKWDSNCGSGNPPWEQENRDVHTYYCLIYIFSKLVVNTTWRIYFARDLLYNWNKDVFLRISSAILHWHSFLQLTIEIVHPFEKSIRIIRL